MSKVKGSFVLLSLILVALVFTGCLGPSKDEASVKAVMDALNKHDFRLFNDWNAPEDVHLEAHIGTLETALGYFSDPIYVSVSSAGNLPNRNFAFSEKLTLWQFLEYDPEWTFEDYQDNLYQNYDPEGYTVDLFMFLLMLIDGNFDVPLYLGHNPEDFSAVETTGGLVLVRSNTATWTKSYSVESPELEVSLGIDVDLVRDSNSDWKIGGVHYKWTTHHVMD